MRLENAIAYLEGPVTQLEVKRLLAEGEAVIAADCRAIDLAGVTRVDSTAVSLLLALRRRALACNRDLVFHHLPASIQSLVQLYGVDDLIPA
jgi:phospholipid transport system transporter-binding protein